ncbi:uncharacterized protein LOC129608382 [Condylostylus longicornis]|uniref:uncharacterized protein LOC129608382 n=1 Tax=Condylostylus longicornis TaxID=2530218 RepID=UPI00244DDC99|nr:uncharacterized protein LOC129608382 [Condylostylus longicornis]
MELLPPPGTVLRQLRQEDAKTINEIWPHRHPGSINFIKRLIYYNLSMGVYKEDTGELIGWCLRLLIGSLGILHIKEGYKRQGFGSLLVRKMSKSLADMNEDTTAPVVIKNTPSRNMFKKLGFEEVGKNYWVDTTASDSNYKWPEDI